MSKIRITVLLLFVCAFAFSAETALAKSRGYRGKDLFSRNGTQTYVDFCTGVYLMLEHRWEEAVVFLERSLQSNPDAERVHNYLATCYFQSNKKEKAIFHVEKIAQLKPDDFSIHYTLGNIYASEGNEKGALSEYERANASAMDDIEKVFISDMLHRLANSYLESGAIEKAVNTYEKILNLELTEEPVKIHYKLGQIYIDAKKIEKAVEEFGAAKKVSPHSEPINFYLALCYEELGEYDNAIAVLESFIEFDHEAWLMRINLSNIYERIHKYENARLEREKAFVILEESINNGSKSLREYITLSQIFRKNGNDKQAAETLKTAITHVIRDDAEALSEVRFMLANIYYDMNRHKNVVAELEKVLQIDPDNHQANNFLGYFFIEMGEQLDKAVRLIKKALRVMPENAAYLDSLGWAYYKLADVDDEKMATALQILIEASNYAEDPEILGHIGDVYYSLGLWEKAQNQWEGALELWGKSTVEISSPLRYESARELKAKETIRNKLEKIQNLKMVETPKEKPETVERVVRNNVNVR